MPRKVLLPILALPTYRESPERAREIECECAYMCVCLCVPRSREVVTINYSAVALIEKKKKKHLGLTEPCKLLQVGSNIILDRVQSVQYDKLFANLVRGN